MIKKNVLKFSMLTGMGYFGDIENDMWLNKKEIKESDVIEFVLSYLMAHDNEVTFTNKSGAKDFKITLEDFRKIKNIKDLK